MGASGASADTVTTTRVEAHRWWLSRSIFCILEDSTSKVTSQFPVLQPLAEKIRMQMWENARPIFISKATRLSTDLSCSQLPQSFPPSLRDAINCCLSPFFLFRSSHLFGGVPLRCKTPTQLQGRQMAQQVPSHSGDAGTRLPSITSLPLPPSSSCCSNWVSSLALYLPLSFLLSFPSTFHVIFFFPPPYRLLLWRILVSTNMNGLKTEIVGANKRRRTIFLSSDLDGVLVSRGRLVPPLVPVFWPAPSVRRVLHLTLFEEVMKLPKSAQPRINTVHFVS